MAYSTTDTKYTNEYKLKLEEKFLISISENINILKNKAKTLEDIYNNSVFIFSYDDILVSKSTILNEKNKIYLTDFFKELSEINNYCEKKISEISEKILKKNNIKFKDLGEPLRMILTGSTKAPSIKDIIKILGINETINRLKRFI